MSSVHEEDDEFSDSDDNSDEEIFGAKGTEMKNQPYDEALDISGSSISVSEGRPSPKRVKELKNQPFDEALELSGSVQEPSPDKKSSVASKQVIKNESFSSNSVKNKPYDEHEDLEDSDSSVDTTGVPSPKKPQQMERITETASLSKNITFNNSVSMSKSLNSTKQDDDDDAVKSKTTLTATSAAATTTAISEENTSSRVGQVPPQSKVVESNHLNTSIMSTTTDGSGDEESSSSSEESESETEQSTNEVSSGKESGAIQSPPSQQHQPTDGYNEKEYANLNVSQDVKDLFQYIGRFKPQDIELETRLKCFIPDYIPAVGEMDAFLKVPRPDGKLDDLGLKVLDEPGLNQSDATVLDLQLRALSKKKHGEIIVRSIDNAEKSPKEIDRWIRSISELHCSKPPPQVHYTKSMPDIETLMQIWPEEMEELLGRMQLPSVDMDFTLEEYIRTICAILDIPVYKNIFESLHVLFTLYLEFTRNQHFMNYQPTQTQDEPMDYLYLRK